MSAHSGEPIPKHLLVREWVKERITAGDVAPGDRLPTEIELMRTLSVSRTPVRQALVELANDGWIYRVRGSGSYVKRTSAISSTDIYAILYSNHRGIERDLVHGMRRAVAQHPTENVHIILKNPGNDTRQLIDVIHEIQKPASGGLVIIPITDPSRSLNRLLGASLRKLADDRFHVVQLDRFVPEYDGHFVGSNHGLGAEKMVKYLVSVGHTRIGCMYEHPETSSIRDRLKGARNVLLNHSIPVDPALQLEIPIADVAARGDEIMSWIDANGISVVFCLESELARELYKVLRRFDRSVPDDISICSFDDHAFSDIKDGFLTAVIQKLEDLGHFAIEILLDALAHGERGSVRMTLEPELVIRSSVAPFRPNA